MILALAPKVGAFKERVGFESACKRKTKDLQRTGSDLRHCKCMKNQRAGFRGFQKSVVEEWGLRILYHTKH